MKKQTSTTRSLLGPSALQAFHADLPLGGLSPDIEDEAAVLAATLLRQEVALVAGECARALVRERAIGIARVSLGEPALAAGCTYDEQPASSDIGIIRLLAQRTEHKGWLNLAHHLLESATELAEDVIDKGRLLADRARNARKQGKLDLAEAQTEELLRLAGRLRSDELTVQAKAGFAALAQTRGNLPAVRAYSEEVLQLAIKANLSRQVVGARTGLGILAAISGDYEEAVGQLWSAACASDGRGVLWNAAFINLAQTLLLSGRLVESRKITILLLDTSPPLQQALPALGGYAISSAHLGDFEAVDWACQHIRRLSRGRHYPREVAGALLECAAAMQIIGRAVPAGVMRRRAIALATAHGFHDLTFTEALDAAMGRLPERTAFTGAGTRVESEIAKLDVPTLPALATMST